MPWHRGWHSCLTAGPGAALGSLLQEVLDESIACGQAVVSSVVTRGVHQSHSGTSIHQHLHRLHAAVLAGQHQGCPEQRGASRGDGAHPLHLPICRRSPPLRTHLPCRSLLLTAAPRCSRYRHSSGWLILAARSSGVKPSWARGRSGEDAQRRLRCPPRASPVTSQIPAAHTPLCLFTPGTTREAAAFWRQPQAGSLAG